MKRFTSFIAIAALVVAFGSASAEDEKPDATLKLSGGSVAAGIGFSWGGGTLTYKGKEYPVDIKGLSVGDVGITSVDASGSVYHLTKLSDFDGNYTGVGTGATVGGGGGVSTMRNQNGVTINLVSTTQGLKVAIAAGGVDMKIKQ